MMPSTALVSICLNVAVTNVDSESTGPRCRHACRFNREIAPRASCFNSIKFVLLNRSAFWRDKHSSQEFLCLGA